MGGVSYVGYNRYFLTICTAFRRPVFRADDVVCESRTQLRRACARFEIAILAYCFMPDHLHLLLAAESERADLKACVKWFKQTTGYAYRRHHQEALWQPGYYDRVLRDDEATEAVIRYLLENPLRAGLSDQVGAYPYAGSEVYDGNALLTVYANPRRGKQA